MYLERSWRRWRPQRWCQIAAKGRPSWTCKLFQPEMRFLENVCSSQSIYVIWLKSLILPWHDQLLPGDVFHNLAACPCLSSSSSTAKTTFQNNQRQIFFLPSTARLKNLFKNHKDRRLFNAGWELPRRKQNPHMKEMNSSQNLLFKLCPVRLVQVTTPFLSNSKLFKVIWSLSK